MATCRTCWGARSNHLPWRLCLGLMVKALQTLTGLLLLLLASPADSSSHCTAAAVESLWGCLCCNCLPMPPAAMLLRAQMLLQAQRECSVRPFSQEIVSLLQAYVDNLPLGSKISTNVADSVKSASCMMLCQAGRRTTAMHCFRFHDWRDSG
jgi:hypothetical protein